MRLALTTTQADDLDLLDADGKAEVDGVPVPVMDRWLTDAIEALQDPACREQLLVEEEAERERLPDATSDERLGPGPDRRPRPRGPARAGRTARAVGVMTTDPPPHTLAEVPRVALTLDEAAASLGVSRRHLDRHIAPHLRIIRTLSARLVPVAEPAKVG